MSKVKISDVGVNDRNLLGISLTDDTGVHEIEFSLPERFVPSTDLIALSMGPLLGQKYDHVEFDLPITDRTKSNLSKILQADVTASRLALPSSAPAGKKHGLNFSGGFDSLAALALMPENHELISLDFGGSFKRERQFFEQFETNIISTNFRELGFAKNHWTFMGIGAILLRDYLELDSYSFGSILEASPWNFKQKHFTNAAQPIFASADLKQYNPVLGLTEVGTVMILAKLMPEYLKGSLESLAAPKSEKLNRKILLLNIVQEIFNDDFGIVATQDSIEPRIKFGNSLASDFLILYIMKNLGRDRAQQLVGEIPLEVDEFIKLKTLKFYEKNNSIFSDSWTLDTKQFVSERLLRSGITPYGESDWKEYRETVKFLSKWYPSLSE